MSTLPRRAARTAEAEADRDPLSSASQWSLMWRKFRRHKLAVVSLYLLGLFYLAAAFSEFVSPQDIARRNNHYVYAPPQRIRFVDANGSFRPRPFVYGLDKSLDPETLREIYTIDTAQRFDIYFFVRGDPYKFWGLVADGPAPVRHPRAGVVPARRRPLRARPAVASHHRIAHLPVRRPGRGRYQLRDRLSAGRRLRLLRWPGGHVHPAPDRVPAVDSRHLAVGGAGRGAAAHLGAAAALLRDPADPLHPGLDRAGAHGARQADRAARGGLRDGGAHRRGPATWRSSCATCCPPS